VFFHHLEPKRQKKVAGGRVEVRESEGERREARDDEGEVMKVSWGERRRSRHPGIERGKKAGSIGSQRVGIRELESESWNQRGGEREQEGQIASEGACLRVEEGLLALLGEPLLLVGGVFLHLFPSPPLSSEVRVREWESTSWIGRVQEVLLVRMSPSLGRPPPFEEDLLF